MWQTTRHKITAEWLCTRCGATNRKLLSPRLAETVDRCMSCKASHTIARAESPVRWTSRAR